MPPNARALREAPLKPDILINLGHTIIDIYVLKPEDEAPAGMQISPCITHPDLRLAYRKTLSNPLKGVTHDPRTHPPSTHLCTFSTN